MCFEVPRRIWRWVKWLKWGWLAYTTPTARDICTFAILFNFRTFDFFVAVLQEEFQKELSRNFIGHRSASFPLLSACRLAEFNSSLICHVSMYCQGPSRRICIARYAFKIFQISANLLSSEKTWNLPWRMNMLLICILNCAPGPAADITVCKYSR